MIKKEFSSEDVGVRLKNGAFVAEMKQDKYCEGYVVLCTKLNGDTIEWVTWITDNKMNAYHGRYFINEKIARSDYLSRVKSHC